MSQTPQLTPYTSHRHRDGRGLLTSRMYASRVGSCLIFVQRTATNCTSSFSTPEPRRSPLSWSSFWQGKERAAGLLAALPPCPGAAVPPHYRGRSATVPGSVWQGWWPTPAHGIAGGTAGPPDKPPSAGLTCTGLCTLR